MSWLFPAACLILVLQMAASRVLTVPERDIPIPELRKLPLNIAGWKGSFDQEMDNSITRYLKPDDYILRWYVEPNSGIPVNLFVAHFKSLQNAYGPHSPRVCLPGAGWLVRSSEQPVLAVPAGGQQIRVNEYMLEKAAERILVLYWYQNDRDMWADEFYAKLRLLPDLLRYRRSDVSLVRLITPLGTAADGERVKCREFAGRLYPLLVERFAAAN